MTKSQTLSNIAVAAGVGVLVGSVAFALQRIRDRKELNSPDSGAQEGGMPQVVEPNGAHA